MDFPLIENSFFEFLIILMTKVGILCCSTEVWTKFIQKCMSVLHSVVYLSIGLFRLVALGLNRAINRVIY